MSSCDLHKEQNVRTRETEGGNYLNFSSLEVKAPLDLTEDVPFSFVFLTSMDLSVGLGLIGVRVEPSVQ